MILQQPDTVSLSGNIKDLIFSSTEEKEVVIQLNDVTVYSGRYTPDNSGNITVKLSDIIPTLLTVPAPNSDDVSVTDISRIVFVASGDNSGEFYCVKGGVSGSVSADTFLRANFLTWQPQILKTFVNAPIFIRYASLGNYLLKVKAYFHDGSNETKTIYNCIENKIYTFNVSFQVIAGKFGRTPSYFDIWVSDSTGEKVSFIQRYALSNYGANDDLFLFENTLGGIDTICFSGVKKEETEVETLSSMQGDDLSIDYDIDFSRAYTKNIGYFPIKILRGWVSEFFRSTQRYHVTEKGIEPIVVSNSNIASEKYVPSSYSFTFAYSKKENYLNFPRLESPPEVVDIIDPDHTVFSLAPRLYEFPLADVGADPLIPVQHPFTDTWRYLPISAITRLENEGGGGSDIDIIKTGDTTPPTENNVFSALRSLGQFHPKGGNESLDFVSKNNTISGDLKVGNNTQIGGNVSVGGTTTTLNAIVQRLATIYDLDVTHVATLFNTVIKNQLSSENFISGFTGEGMKLWKAINGDWNLEIDNLTARKAFYVFELILQKIRSINGALAITQGNGTIKSVSETTGDPIYYVCEIEGDMTFEVGDLVRCQVFSASRLKYYWVKIYQVTGNSIYLLKSDFSTDIPEAGDEIVQIGNDTNPNRQSVLYLSASEDGKPRFSVLDGVNSPSFVGKTKAVLGYIGDIIDSSFPAEHQPSGYGLYCQNAFLSGIFVLSNGKSVEDEIGNINTQIIAIPGLISSSVTEEVSKIEIGGRNLVLKSDQIFTARISSKMYDMSKTWLSLKGKTVAISFDYSYTNATTDSSNHILWFEKALDTDTGTSYALSRGISLPITSAPISGSGRYTGMAVVPSNIVSTSTAKVATLIIKMTGGSGTITNFKIEEGNKSTDWTPAPEDVQAELDSKVAVTVYESGITQLQSSIDSKVSQTNFDALGNRVSAVETEIVQTPNKITQAIKETSIGGDNLLPNLQQRWARGRINSGTGAIEVPSGTGWSYVRINIYCAEFFPVNGGETLVFSAPTDKSYTCFPAQYDASKKFIPVAPEQYYMRNYYDESQPDNLKILTLKPQTRYVRWQIQGSTGVESGDFYPSWFATNHAQVEIGNKPTAYKEPFTDVTYTGIDIQQGKIWLTADKVEITGEVIAKGISTGGINIGNGNCIITSTGLITAKGANIEGKITATSGSIGGVSISNNRIGIDSSSTSAVGSFLAAEYLGVRNRANYFRVDANTGALQCTIDKTSDTTPALSIRNATTSSGANQAMAIRSVGRSEFYGGVQVISGSSVITDDSVPKIEVTSTDLKVTLRVNNTGAYITGYLRITSSPATGGAATVQFVRD